jgi:dihydroflavonol-4-reductase
VVHFLLERGHSVRCLLRETSKTQRIDHLDFERHLGDIRDEASLIEGMSGCDAVIHLASISAWDQIRSPLMRTIVIDGTRNVLNAAKRTGDLRVIFVSTMVAVNGTSEPELLNENSPFSLPTEPFVYGNAKREAEEMCFSYFRDHSLPVLIVNPCEVWGPNDDDFITAEYARDTIKDWPAMTVKGGTALAHVDDIARGIASATEKGRAGERYILGGENVHASEITAMIL